MKSFQSSNFLCKTLKSKSHNSSPDYRSLSQQFKKIAISNLNKKDSNCHKSPDTIIQKGLTNLVGHIHQVSESCEQPSLDFCDDFKNGAQEQIGDVRKSIGLKKLK